MKKLLAKISYFVKNLRFDSSIMPISGVETVLLRLVFVLVAFINGQKFDLRVEVVFFVDFDLRTGSFTIGGVIVARKIEVFIVSIS